MSDIFLPVTHWRLDYLMAARYWIPIVGGWLTFFWLLSYVPVLNILNATPVIVLTILGTALLGTTLRSERVHYLCADCGATMVEGFARCQRCSALHPTGLDD